MVLETTKIEKVYHQLRGKIEQMPSGAPLPSIRNVMKEFEVSQFTVDRALDLLLKENLIVKQPKGRTYVGEAAGETRPARKHSIVIAAPNYVSVVYESYLIQLSLAAERIGEVAEVIRYDWRNRILQELPSNKEIDGLILVPTSHRLTPEDFYGLSKFEVPVVLISRVLRDIAMDAVEPDNEIGGELAAEHLIGLGHRKLAILVGQPIGVSTDSRVGGFCRKAKSLGIGEVEIISCDTRPGEHANLVTYEKFKAKMVRDGKHFTGLFVDSDGSALGALKALHDLKISIPGEVSVVGYDDLPDSRVYYPSLTTIHEDHAEVARVAVEIIEKRLSGDREGTIQRTIPPTLIKRESTGPAPASAAIPS
jgi:DNA-binding LacI/PurR family transcriptional regulator